MSKFKVGDEVWLSFTVTAVEPSDEENPVGVVVNGGTWWPNVHRLHDTPNPPSQPPDLSAYTSHTSAEMVEWCGVGREVVRGVDIEYEAMVPPGCVTSKTAFSQKCRKAIKWGTVGWDLIAESGKVVRPGATEPQAIAWVLDGKLPSP